MNKNKLKLEGFNNLTKTLSFNIYDVCFARTRSDLKSYLEYIDEGYNADRLTCILKDVTRIINANVLNIAHQDYEPHGASVTMLIAEGDMPDGGLEDQAQTPGPLIPRDKQNIEPKLSSRSLVAHLDKSHITVHTYPEIHPTRGISTFRVDIDVSTCGHISPLKALNYLIHSFESDIVIMDYRVRGFTRDIDGTKHFIDHEIHSIQEFLSADTKARYQRLDVNVYDEQMFHTKMRLSEFDVEEYLFNVSATSLTQEERRAIEEEIQHEITEIYYGKNRVR